jgi:hypothetical protein
VKFDILKKLIPVAASQLDLEAVFTEEFIKKYLGKNPLETGENPSFGIAPAFASTGDTYPPSGDRKFSSGDNNNSTRPPMQTFTTAELNEPSNFLHPRVLIISS